MSTETNEATPQQIFAQSLLNLATWYAVHSEAPVPSSMIVGHDKILDISVSSFEAKQEQIRAIGPGEKKYDDKFFRYIVKGDGFKLDFFEYRDKVCVRKVVGTKTIPAKVIPATAAQVIPEREEEIVEWECPGSLLAPDAAHETVEMANG